MSDYTDRVEAGLEGLEAVSTGYCPGCQECIDTYGETGEHGDYPVCEPAFSWSSCGICGSELGGDREPWHGIDAEGEIQHFNDACMDCVLFLANGDEPDG